MPRFDQALYSKDYLFISLPIVQRRRDEDRSTILAGNTKAHVMQNNTRQHVVNAAHDYTKKKNIQLFTLVYKIIGQKS